MHPTGILDLHRLELIEGEIIDQGGAKRPHTITQTSARSGLIGIFGWEYIETRSPIDVAPKDNPTNEPQPDLIVLAQPFHTYRSGNIPPSDLRLVAEIADTTQGFDLTVKAPLYARAGIPEYRVFDVPGEQLIVHRNPADGKYKSITICGKHESVRPLAAPDQEFPVAEAFPE
jgi:Uma2 family endonuclease